MSQVHISTNEQGQALVNWLLDNLGSNEGALLTQAGPSVYASTGLASASIDPAGEVDES